MEEQNYAKHRKFVPLFHRVLLPLLLVTFLGSVYNLYKALDSHSGRRDAVLILILSFAAFLTAGFARMFALKAQDRVIRVEENLRHVAATGTPLDKRLTVKQIVALRFASDAEFPELARKAAEGGLAPDAIKKSIKNWRPDYDRL